MIHILGVGRKQTFKLVRAVLSLSNIYIYRNFSVTVLNSKFWCRRQVIGIWHGERGYIGQWHVPVRQKNMIFILLIFMQEGGGALGSMIIKYPKSYLPVPATRGLKYFLDFFLILRAFPSTYKEGRH